MYIGNLFIDELVNLDTPAAVHFVEQLTRDGVTGYADIIDAGVKDGVFRRTIGADIRITGQCRAAGDIHDAPPALRQHRRQHRLTA